MEIQHIIINIRLTGICKLWREYACTIKPRHRDIKLTRKRIDYHRHDRIAPLSGKHIPHIKHTPLGKIVSERMDSSHRVRSSKIHRGRDLIRHHWLVILYHRRRHIIKIAPDPIAWSRQGVHRHQFNSAVRLPEHCGIIHKMPDGILRRGEHRIAETIPHQRITQRSYIRLPERLRPMYRRILVEIWGVTVKHNTEILIGRQYDLPYREACNLHISHWFLLRVTTSCSNSGNENGSRC